MNRVRVLLLALGLSLAFSVSAETITLLETLEGQSTLRFIDSAAPSVSLGTVVVTGMRPGETLSGIDYRPATGQLYGLGSLGGNSAQLYQINTSTGVAAPMGLPFALFGANVIGIDFNPVVDRVRVITTANQNIRINPTTGEVFVDTNTDYAPGDPNAGAGNAPWAVAYTNNVPGAVQTTLYGLTYGRTSLILITIGSPNGTPASPNTGLMFTVGSTGITNANSQSVGLDISAGGIAYALINSPAQLYTVNLTNGQVTLVGPFPTTSALLRDLSVGGPIFQAATPTVPTVSPAMLAVLAGMLAAAAIVALRR
ncbi:MAG TPA: DUF4394 domain-containing protein [Thermoanaerobaculia bacterium]|nr:DUF4394 domain-containing protein [Thermoanaerobaculia bacterium]